MRDLSWVVPYRPTSDLHRERCWRWIRERGETLFGVAPIIGDRPGPVFSHSAAFNEGVARAETPYVLLTDTDTTVDPVTFGTAVDLVRDGEQRWAMAADYVKIDQSSTHLLLRSHPLVTIDGRVDLDTGTEWVGRSWAGFLVIRRDDYLDVGGYDERISAWGANDGIMGVTLTSLLGATDRVPGQIWHLWHDNAYERDHGMNDAEWALVRQYEADPDPVAVRRAMEGKP